MAVSAVSAADNATSDAVSVEKTTDEVVSVEENQVSLKENTNSGTFDDLQTEINNAPAGSVLNLTRDYNGHSGSRIQFNKDLTIDGQGHTLDCLGEGGCSAFYSERGNITLKNLIIINGYNDFTGKGGAIYIVESAQYTIINCTFNNNWAKGFGGAIYSEANKPLTIINCSFNNNKANYINGGAIYWFNVNDCTVTNCNFTGNTANNDGGAIYGERSTSTVTNCSFTGNTANNNSGGAIYWYLDVNAAVTNCSFTGNTANNNSGGAIYWNGANGAVTNCNFTDNKANNNSGGAIYWIGANGNITDCTFIGNSARFNGGAIYWIGANGTVTHCNFTGNIVRHGESGCGGAIHWNGDNGAVTHCNFIGNTARCNGGAVYWNGVNGAVTHCNFTRNSADPAGGAVYWTGANGNITDCNFTGNKAEFNGGAVYWNGVNGAITHCNFTDNTANGVYAGGAVYWEGVNGAVTHCNFTGNTANYGYGAYGGAINWEGANGTVTHCNFIGNTASKFGGAIYWQRENDVDGNITDCTFIRNSAIWGGAIYWKAVNGTVTHCNFTGNTASYGGAIYWRNVNDCTVTYCNFKSNTAKGGGAIFWYLSVSGTVTHCNFTDNTANWAKCGGGAIYTKSSVKCVDSIFSGNSAYQDGGAIYAKGNVDVKNSIFENNKAEGTKTYNCYGGAIRSEKDVKIDNCSFLNNHASNYGGAIYSDTITWVNNLPSYFIGNYAEKNEGGAIYTDKFTTDIKYGVFINNTVKSNNDGGAIYINRENHLLISQCYFENNRCEDEGGAIYLESTSSTLSLKYNIFVDNHAGTKGNIVYIKGKYNKIHNNWYGVNNFDFSNELVEYNAWGSDESHRDDKMVIVELSLNETNAGEPSTLIVTFLSDEELFNYDAKFSADNGAELSNHKIGNNTVTSDIVFNDGITTVNATVNREVLKLSYSPIKKNLTMDINAAEISFGDNATVNIIFTPSNATGTVIVGNISAMIVNGTASVVISDLSVGNHTFLVSYSGDEVYNPNYGNVTITVNRKNLDIGASAEPIYKGENATVIVTGLEGATGNVTVTVNNNNWTGQITNGTATIIIPGLQENSTGNVTYVGDVNYSNASTIVNIFVNSGPRVDLNISASADSIMVGENAIIVVTGLENATGNVTVSIGGDKWYGEINNGTATVIVSGLKMNTTANVFYPGDYQYNNATTFVNITVNPAITVWYVNGSKESSGNGTTPETAFKTLQEALNKAPEDSIIYIAQGTYTGENNINLTIDKNLTFINYGDGEVIFDAQFNSRIWTVYAGRINITGLTFKNGKEEEFCGAIFFNQTLNNSYINAIFIDNNVVEGIAGAIGFYEDVFNTNIDCIFVNNSVVKGYGGAIFFNGNLNNVNITGNYTTNTASDGAGAIFFNGNLNNVNIDGSYTGNIAKDGGAFCFVGNLTDVNIMGSYNYNCANDTAGVFFFDSNLTNVNISGDYSNNNAAQYCGVYYMSESVTVNNSSISGNYYNNSADFCVVSLIEGTIINSNITGNYINNNGMRGVIIIGEAYNLSMSGYYLNNNISDGGVIYIFYCDENSSIHDSIFVNSTVDDSFIIQVISGSVLSVDNWFGNNASNYNIKPLVNENVTMVNWLFLNGTTNSTGDIKVNETSLITFTLYEYDSVSEEIKEFDASKMNIHLDLSQINGMLNQTTALFNETVLYTCMEEGAASITGNLGTASYTIILAPKTNATLTIDPIVNVAVGEEITIKYNTNSNGTVTIKVNGEPITGGKFTPISAGVYNLTVEVAENEYYTGVMNESSFFVKLASKITASPVTTTYNVGKYLVITLKDSNGKPISGAVLTVSLGGSKKYNTNANGQVKINVATLTPKTYNAKITYSGSDSIKGSTGSVKVTVKKAKPKITAKAAKFKLRVKTKKYTAIFKDNKNRAIKNTKVTLKVYGKTYSVKTNSKGQGVFKITNLKKIGSYIGVLTFPANKYYNKVTKKVKIIVKK